jgi:hypothetical protein
MRVCPECSYVNLEGTLICEECGFPTTTPSVTATQRMIAVGTTILETTAVILEFKGYPAPVELQHVARMVFGRLDATAPNKPDFDLTPYGAYEKGVSRIHAAIIREDDILTVLDLGSANGTSVNGKRIPPNQPRVLQDGDEIVFGELAARVHFK